MITAAAIVAGGVGALARYGLTGFVQRRTRGPFPWGTAAVNLSGAALLGVLLALHAGDRIPDSLVTIAGTGFTAGFTTFSTWMVETLQLAEPPTRRQLGAAVINVVGMFVAGVAVAAATRWLLAP